jgi:hypothetical protein
METYFRETGSNARVYITCFYDFIKIQPAIQLPRGKDDGPLINFNITGGAIGPGGIVNHDTYFTFMARFGGNTFECRIDNGDWCEVDMENTSGRYMDIVRTMACTFSWYAAFDRNN